MDAGFYVYRGPRDSFVLPGASTKRLKKDGEPVELDRREASICGRYAYRGHRFEFMGAEAPAPEPEGDAGAGDGGDIVDDGVDVKPLDKHTVPELQEIAAGLEIEGRSDMKKAELIAAIEKHQAG